MDWTFLIWLPVAIGAVLQRVTGMGFALTAAPFVVLIYGANAGVMLVNVLSALAAGIGLVTLRRAVVWRRLASLLVAAVPGVVAGVLLLQVLDPATSEIVVGSVLLLAVLASAAIRTAVVEHSTGGLLATGVAAGFGSALAGVSGPAIAAYAALTGWRATGLAATMQGLFLGLAVTTVTVKLVSGAAALPALTWFAWAAMALSLVGGLVVGELLERVLPRPWAWRLLIVIAATGAAATVLRGVLSLRS